MSATRPTRGARQPRPYAWWPERGELGQASVEMLAGLPALLIAGLVALQLLATGYSASLADGAAEAGALAAAAGTPPRAAAKASLPGWARQRANVAIESGEVKVTLEPPSPIGSIAKRLSVVSAAPVKRR